PASMPMASLTMSEVEVAAMGGSYAAGHFTSAPYFMGYESPENKKFVDAYQARYGKDRVTNLVTAAAHTQIYEFSLAAEKILKDGDQITPVNIRNVARGLEYKAPQGLVKVDRENDHTYVWPKVGQWQQNGQAKVVKQTDHWVEPLP